MEYRGMIAGGLIAAATLFMASASGAAITYNVDQTIGVGSVVGTIQTDGATGVLSASDITAYNLDLTGMGATFNLTNSNSSAFVGGSDLTATATDLFFNYSGGDDGHLLFQVSFGSGSHYYCNATSTDLCFQGKTVAPESIFDSSAQVASAEGNQIIGVAGVPEPETWTLMLLGAAGLGASLRRRKAHVALA